MNSILQCLSNTRELRDYCLQRVYTRDLGHSSTGHTALMEGAALVWVCPLIRLLPTPCYSNWLLYGFGFVATPTASDKG